jgi:hypothetical protein
MYRYVRDSKTKAVFLKDPELIQKRNLDITTQERLDRLESEIHKLRDMMEQLIQAKTTERA